MTWEDLIRSLDGLLGALGPFEDPAEWAGLEPLEAVQRIASEELRCGDGLNQKLKATILAGQWPPVLTPVERWLLSQRILLAIQTCERGARELQPLPKGKAPEVVEHLLFWTDQQRAHWREVYSPNRN